jgi:hypothetical protein
MRQLKSVEGPTELLDLLRLASKAMALVEKGGTAPEELPALPECLGLVDRLKEAPLHFLAIENFLEGVRFLDQFDMDVTGEFLLSSRRVD